MENEIKSRGFSEIRIRQKGREGNEGSFTILLHNLKVSIVRGSR
jgi:hypothetical protein